MVKAGGVTRCDNMCRVEVCLGAAIGFAALMRPTRRRAKYRQGVRHAQESFVARATASLV